MTRLFQYLFNSLVTNSGTRLYSSKPDLKEKYMEKPFPYIYLCSYSILYADFEQCVAGFHAAIQADLEDNRNYIL